MSNDPDRWRREYPSRRSPWRIWGGVLLILIILWIIWTYWSDANSLSVQPSATPEPAPAQQ